MIQESGREAYRSVLASARAEIVEKRSRFLAFAFPVATEEEVVQHLHELRESHPTASHVCYAYRVGIDSPTIRMNDDREPQGTAGRPILEVLERNGLDNVLVAVVRYFGGTLLGAAGLTRAYAAAAAAGVDAAGIVRYVRHAVMRARFTYADWPRIERLLRDEGVHLLGVEYLADVDVTWAVVSDRAERLEKAIAEATAGAGVVQTEGERFLPVTDRES